MRNAGYYVYIAPNTQRQRMGKHGLTRGNIMRQNTRGFELSLNIKCEPTETLFHLTEGAGKTDKRPMVL